jgi:hypothetical protein
MNNSITIGTIVGPRDKTTMSAELPVYKQTIEQRVDSLGWFVGVINRDVTQLTIFSVLLLGLCFLNLWKNKKLKAEVRELKKKVK